MEEEAGKVVWIGPDLVSLLFSLGSPCFAGRGYGVLPARIKRPDAWCPTYMIRLPFMLNRTGGL